MSFEENLIEQVKSFPHLYNTSSEDYKDKQMALLSWSTISEKLGKPAGECKERWKYLRDQYAKKKKALEGRSGDPGTKRHKWRFFDSLSFLADHIKHRRTETNISV